jgi:hypothetical protein
MSKALGRRFDAGGDGAAEGTSFPREVCEMALAHAVERKVEAAYRRGDLFERRRGLMADWAGFVSGHVSGNHIRNNAHLGERL